MARAPALPLCFDFLPDGRLLVVSGREGRLLRHEPDGSLVTHADLTGARAVRRGTTSSWTAAATPTSTAPASTSPAASSRPGSSALRDARRRGARGGRRRRVPQRRWRSRRTARRWSSPSPTASCLTAFDIGADGGLSGRRVWADLGDGVPDGICLDAEGAVWYADVPNRRCVRVAEGGEVLATVDARPRVLRLHARRRRRPDAVRRRGGVARRRRRSRRPPARGRCSRCRHRPRTPGGPEPATGVWRRPHPGCLSAGPARREAPHQEEAQMATTAPQKDANIARGGTGRLRPPEQPLRRRRVLGLVAQPQQRVPPAVEEVDDEPREQPRDEPLPGRRTRAGS